MKAARRCAPQSWKECFECPYPDCVVDGYIRFKDEPHPAGIAPKTDPKKTAKARERYYQKKAEKAGV